MDLRNISEATEWFEVLQTSDQVLLMLRGELTGKVGREKVRLKKGDVLLIPAGTPHRFTNKASKPAVTFNVYTPPEYPAGLKG